MMLPVTIRPVLTPLVEGFRLAGALCLQLDRRRAPTLEEKPMEDDPPYLSTGDQRADIRLSIVGDVDSTVIEIEVHGQWSARLCVVVNHALQNCLAEQPAAIIVDLHGLGDLDAASTIVWLAASRAASTLQPPVQLVLSLPPTRQLASHLRRQGAVRFLPIYATMKRARLAVAARLPSMTRLHLSRLPPKPGSAGVAADAVAVACAAWGLPPLAEPGRQIMTELVTNAIACSGTDMAVTMSLRGTGLHLAVYDSDERLPGPLDPAVPGAADGHYPGLPVVESQASAWGAMPTRHGKVVWAILRPRHRTPPWRYR
jgi:hypothetical protein